MIGVYPDLDFPKAPESRPYVFVNMVTTIDGKIITGERDEAVADLGSKLDHATMHQIEATANGIIMGAQTVRACPIMNLPPKLKRYVVTKSGGVNPEHPIFAQAPEKSWLVRPFDSGEPGSIPEIRFGEGTVDFVELFKHLREEHEIDRLLCEGGSELNAQLMTLDLVDEIFWTVAPKIKLGRDVPTMADGEPLPRANVMNWRLVSCRPEGDEIFLRYRRDR